MGISTPLESLVGSLALEVFHYVCEVFHYVLAAYPAVELVFEFIISLENCALNPSVMSLRILRPLQWRNTYVQSFLTQWSKQGVLCEASGALEPTQHSSAYR